MTTPHNETHSRRISPIALFAAAAIFGATTGCKSSSNQNQAAIVDASDPNAPDPAASNLAPGGGSTGQPTQVLGTSSSYAPQQQSESYPQQQAPAPVVQGQPGDYSYNNNDAGYDQGTAGEAVAQTDQAPPPLPEYDQPADPDPNYIWTPGYWAWGSGGYYWVPGAWCPPPYYGALWTPPYWGWYGGHYRFNHGYWGPHVGFYGGVDYGFGYVGIGFFGGYWHGHDFYYNREVAHLGPGIRTVYEHPVIVNNIHYGMQPIVRVSFNGGRGGINVQPRPGEIAAMHEVHTAPIAAQVQLHQQAAANRQNFFAENHGRPAEAAVARPIAPANRIAEPPPAVRSVVAAREAAAVSRPAAPVNRPNPEMNRPNPEVNRPNPEMNRPGPEAARPGAPAPNEAPRGGGQPMQRPGVQPVQPQRPEAQPMQRPQPQRPEPQPMQRPQAQPMQQQRTEPQPMQQRSAPQPQQQRAPQVEQVRPAVPVQRAQPAPAPRPEPAPRAAEPAPAPRPAAPAPRPAAPAPRPAAPAPHPAPAPAQHEEHR